MSNRCGSTSTKKIVTGPISDYWGLIGNKLYANRDGVAIGFLGEPNYMLHVHGSLSATESILTTAGTSLEWNSVYTVTNNNSANWDSTYTTVKLTSADWVSVYTEVNSNSAEWESVYTTVNLQSGEWDSTWNTLTANSGFWQTAYTHSQGSGSDHSLLGATPGTVEASKAVIVDSNKDISGYRNVTIDGNLTVNGDTTTVSTTNLVVEDKLVTLNKGGAANSGHGTGIEIEEDSNITGYFKTSMLNDEDKWVLKAPDGNILTIDINADKQLTIAGDLSVSDNSSINQSVLTTAAPTFAAATIGQVQVDPIGVNIEGGVINTSTGNLTLYSAGGSVAIHDNIDITNQATQVLIKDDTSRTLNIIEGTNKYLTIDTLNNAEEIKAWKQVTFADNLSADKNLWISEGASLSGSVTLLGGLTADATHHHKFLKFVQVTSKSDDNHSLILAGGIKAGNGITDKIDLNVYGISNSSITYFDLTKGADNNNPGLAFRRKSDSTTTMVIDPNDQQVGIGTVAPSHTLHVVGDVGISEYLYHAGDTDTFLRFGPESGDEFTLQVGGLEILNVFEDDSQDVMTFNNDSGNLALRIKSQNAADAFYMVGDSGYIGINTFEPTDRFTVAGNLSAKDVLATNYANVSADLHVSNSAYIDNDVSITGSAAVQSNLTVQGTTNLNGNNIIGDSSSDQLTINSSVITLPVATTLDCADNIILDSNTGNIILKHGGTESSRFTQTTTTSLLLDVVGDFIIDAGGGNITFRDDNTEELDFSNSNGDWTIKPLTEGKDVIFAKSDNTEIARFDSSGTALRIPSNNKLEFRNGNEYIQSGDGGDLDLIAPNEIHLTAPTVNIDASTDCNVSNNLTVGGNLIVNGTTTTVNSTVVTIDDPIFTLGGDTIPPVDDNKDRGIEFRWHDGQSARTGFFGLDDDKGRFVFIPIGTNTSETYSGTLGEIEVGGGLLGNVQVAITGSNEIDTSSGNLTIDSTGGTVTIDDNLIVTGDIFANDDVSLNSDSAVLSFGADSEITLTHVPDSGIQLNSASAILFRDSNIHISSIDDGHLDLAADVSIDHNASTINFGLGTTADTIINFIGTNTGEVKWDQSESQLLFNTNLIIADYTDSKVGINIEAGTNPTHTLHVSGGKDNDIVSIFDCADSGSFISFRDDNTGGLFPVVGAIGDDIVIGTNRDGASVKNHLVLDTSLSAIVVGTFTYHPTPKATFEVRNDELSNKGHGQLALSYDSTYTSYLSTDGDGDLHIRPHGSSYVNFGANDVQLRRIVSENYDDVEIQIGASTGSTFTIDAGGGTDVFTVDGGEGTAGFNITPTSNARLSIKDYYNDQLRLYYNSNNYAQFKTQSTGVLKITNTRSGNSMTEGVYISGGRLGIAVSDPDHTLEIGPEYGPGAAIHINPFDEAGITPLVPPQGSGGILYTDNNGNLNWISYSSQAGLQLSKVGMNKNSKVAETGNDGIEPITKSANAGGFGTSASSSGCINAIGNGSFANGYAAGSSNARIHSHYPGDFAAGHAYTGTIHASGGGMGSTRLGGSFAFGLVENYGAIKTNRGGAFAVGNAYGGSGGYGSTNVIGALSAANYGSVAIGIANRASLLSEGRGAFALGNATANYSSASYDTNAAIHAKGSGAFALGFANMNYGSAFGYGESYVARIKSLAPGSFALGYAVVDTSSMVTNSINKDAEIYTSSSAKGAFATGYARAAQQQALIKANKAGAFATGNAYGATILANGKGAFAGGHAKGFTNSSFGSQVANYKISANSAGAFAFGYSKNAYINADNEGAVAFGFAYGANIGAAGKGAFAVGYAKAGGGGSVRTSGKNAAQFGYGLNNVENSLAVGGYLRLRNDNFANFSNHVSSNLRTGDMWIKDVGGTKYVYIRSGDANVKIT